MRIGLTLGLMIFGAALPAGAAAQDSGETSAERQLSDLKQCRTIEEPSARLACFDREVGAVIAATEQGTLQVVDKQEVEQTKRSLFGFTLPKLRMFGDDDQELTVLETTITRVRQTERDSWVFTTEEGSEWRINDAPMRFRAPKEGQAVVFKKASLGTYFIRVNGQIGVKGRRIG